MILWRSDGTNATTFKIDGQFPDRFTRAFQLVELNDTVFFVGRSTSLNVGEELWKTDGKYWWFVFGRGHKAWI